MLTVMVRLFSKNCLVTSNLYVQNKFIILQECDKKRLKTMK